MALLSTIDTDAKEADWVQLAQQGDQWAFHQLYLKYHRRIYALSLRLAGDVTLAEELTQECFVHLWHQLDKFDGRSAFSTWMHRVCVNQCLGGLRKQRRFWHRFLPETSEPAVYCDSYQGLDKVLLKLPTRTRQVFVLFALEGYQHDEIASLLGIAQGTSKAQYHRARTLLKEMLA